MLEGYNQFTNAQKNTFADIANKLLQYTFLARDKKDNKEAYYFVISYKEVFDEFFRVLDYEINFNRELGAIQLVHATGANLRRLKKDETIILLILRILYQEKMKETSINENVIVTINDIHEMYSYLEFKRRITKTDLVSILRGFRRINLLEPMGDITLSTTRLVLFPTMLMVINSSNLNELVALLNKMALEGKDEK